MCRLVPKAKLLTVGLKNNFRYFSLKVRFKMIRTRQGLSRGMKGLLILNLTFLKNYRKLFFKPTVSSSSLTQRPKYDS